ncbi:enoyl-CoA hydratase-related protein [Desulfocicer niacini]
MIENRNIDIVIQNKVMRIGINRPEKRNALTGDMYDAMSMALRRAKDSVDVKTVLLHGTRDAFSAGNDLKEFDNRNPDKPSHGAIFLMTLQSFKKPVVAAVSGLAVGVGVTLLLHCDLAYAAFDTRFRMPFVNLGVCPEAGSTLLLPVAAGYKKAAEALMLGDFFETSTAMELGLVNGVVPSQELFNYAVEKAEYLAKQPQRALLLVKQLLKQDYEQALAQRMTLEFTCFSELLLTPESIEARGKLQNRSSKAEDY